jgi:hypothetical protein
VGFPGSDKSQHVQLGLVMGDKRTILPDALPGVKPAAIKNSTNLWSVSIIAFLFPGLTA